MPDGQNSRPACREALVGWRFGSHKASLAFFPPEPLSNADAAQVSGLMPGSDLAGRIFQIRCPYDLTLRCSPGGVLPVRFTRDADESRLSEAACQALVSPVLRTAQRDLGNPAVQISLNMHFLTEEEAVLVLMPPFLSPGFRDWPGSLVSGRFPLKSWPRPLNAVLEWQERDRPWRLRRGAPMAYIWVQFADPAARPRLVQSATTPALKRHMAQVENVMAWGRNVAPMFAQAEARRPARLLVEKEIGCPEFSSTASQTS